MTGLRLTVCLACILFVLPAALTAQPAGPADALVKKTDNKVITIYMGQSARVQSPWPAKRVAVTDPKVAEVQVLSPKEVLVQGKSVGRTDLMLWSEDEKQIWQAKIQVELDVERLQSELRKLFPDTTVTVGVFAEMAVLRGKFSRAEQIEQLHRLLEVYEVKYIDLTELAGVQQVILRVRIAEVSRDALRTMGINAFWADDEAFGGITLGSEGGPLVSIPIGVESGTNVRTVPFTFRSDVTPSASVTVFGGIPDAQLEFFVQALAENRFLRIMAEPNLVALSGEEGSFLAGGEFPIPVVQGTGGGTSITIEYRQFGVNLKFRPTVLGDGRIRLFVAPEISELSDTGAIEIQGFRIPSVITRKAQTTVELYNRQTFAIAGLIRRQDTARVSKVPFLGDIPILGALFRSVRYSRSETEMLVLVTPMLAEPLSRSGAMPVPGSTHVVPNDWELYARGWIRGQVRPPVSAIDSQWLKEKGFGRLRGPGAWARYGPGGMTRRRRRLPLLLPKARPRPIRPLGPKGPRGGSSGPTRAAPSRKHVADAP